MDTTTHLGLPYIMAAQAQKHVTHNEAIRRLDAVVQLAALDRDLPAPPASPDDGDRYIIASAASGDWIGKAGWIAAWQDGAWEFYEPYPGGDPPGVGWRQLDESRQRRTEPRPDGRHQRNGGHDKPACGRGARQPTIRRA